MEFLGTYFMICLAMMLALWALIICPPMQKMVERFVRARNQPSQKMILARKPAKVYHINRYR